MIAKEQSFCLAENRKIPLHHLWMECKQRSVSDISDAGQIVTQLHCRIYPTWGSEGVNPIWREIHTVAAWAATGDLGFKVSSEGLYSTDEEVELFHETLERFIKSTPTKDFLGIQGDWNTKIGPDAYTHWSGTVGQFGLGETNNRGLRLLEFAKSHRLSIANTMYPLKLSLTD